MRTAHLTRGVVVLAATALIATSVTAMAPSAAYATTRGITVGGGDTLHDVTPSVPLVESSTGWGAGLTVTPGSSIDLKDRVAGSGVLVRLTVAAEPADVTVFTGDPSQPTAVLFAAHGRTVSTTTLLRVVDGAVVLWADSPADVRIEPLLGLDGRAPTYTADGVVDQPGTPGATVTLDRPARRADTARGLGGDGLAVGDPANVGLAGLGENATSAPGGVRSAYAAFSIDLTTAATVAVGGARLPLPAGRSVFTTIVAPDEQGLADVSLSAGTGSLVVDVLGWVPDGDAAVATSNVTGGLVPLSLTDPVDVAVDGEAPSAFDDRLNGRAAYSLVLVSADPSDRVGAVAYGDRLTGRTSGIAVDGAGALPQLALAPADSAGNFVSNGITTELTVHALYEYLGDPSADQPAGGNTLAIDSHHDGDHVDLDEHGYFTLGGHADVDDTIERVEISVVPDPSVPLDADDRDGLGAGGYVMNADLDYRDDGTVGWSAQVGAPVDGRYRYAATLVTSSGLRATRSVGIDVTAIDSADGTITTSSRTVVLNGDGGDAIQATFLDPADPRTLQFAVLPEEMQIGDVLVSAVTDAMPDGFLGRVLSIEQSGETWAVHTEEAHLADVVLDADIQRDITLSPDRDAVTVEDGTTEVVVKDPESGQILPSDDVSAADLGLESPPAAAADAGGDVVPDADAGTDTGAGAGVGADTASGGRQLSALGSWDSNVNQNRTFDFTFTPAYYLTVGGGKVIVTDLSGQPDNVLENARMRVTDLPIPGLFDAYFRATVKASVDLSVRLSASVKNKWGFIPTGAELKEFSVQATARTSVDAAVAAQGTVKKDVTLATPVNKASLPSVTVWLGPIPLVFSNTLNVTVDSAMSLKASVYLTNLGTERTDRASFSYTSRSGSQWSSRIDSFTLKPIEIKAVGGQRAATLDGSVDVGPTATLDVLLYGTIGPSVVVKPRLHASGHVEASQTPGKSTPNHVELGVRSWATLDGEVRGKIAIKSWNLLNINLTGWSLSQDLYARTWSWDF